MVGHSVGTSSNSEKQDTLNQRYFYKLSSNIVAIFAGIITSAIVPRALGVRAYGDFSFVNNVISQILSFLDMRASTCFYVKLSQRQSENKIISFYGLYTLLVFVLLLLVLVALCLPFTRQFLFEDIGRRIILFSFCFVVIKWVTDIFIKISDAYGTTIAIERIKVINTILSVTVLLVLFYFKVITLSIFYLHQIALFSILILLIFSFFKRNNYRVPLLRSLERADMRAYAREFFSYSSPLVIYLIATLITEIFDRYILQHFGGSYQQGLYGFSLSISNMTILFVIAMMPLFTRELSIALSTGNIQQAADLYRKYVPTMYVISAYFCCFLFVNVEGLINFFGGEQYKESLVPLKIMLLYPLISTYSTLNSSVIYAKSNTTFIRNITLVLSPLGMIVTYLLISSNCMNLGAAGLAVKVASLELVSVVIMLFHISNFLKIRLYKYFTHMIFSPVALLLISFGLKSLLSFFTVDSASNLYAFICSGALYTLCVGLLIFFFPAFIGISRQDIMSLVNKLKFNRP